MTEDKCKEDKTCNSCDQTRSCSEQDKEAHAQERVRSTLAQIKHRILVMSGKGGVGKSTVSTNLAVALSLDGFAVGLMDADIHGPNIPKMLGIESRQVEGSSQGMVPIDALPNLKVISMAFFIGDRDNPVVWRGPLKHSAISQFLGEVAWGSLDYLVVDLTTPQDVALLDSRKAVTFSRMLQIPVIGIIENMSGLICPHCQQEILLFKKGGGEEAASELRVPFLGQIPIDPEMVSDCDRGVPFVMAHPDSKAAAAFREIARRSTQYVGFNQKERKEQREQFPNFFKGQEVER
jgi:ATP-binding protein involved in chromosome partitioning